MGLQGGPRPHWLSPRFKLAPKRSRVCFPNRLKAESIFSIHRRWQKAKLRIGKVWFGER